MHPCISHQIAVNTHYVRDLTIRLIPTISSTNPTAMPIAKPGLLVLRSPATVNTSNPGATPSIDPSRYCHHGMLLQPAANDTSVYAGPGNTRNNNMPVGVMRTHRSSNAPCSAADNRVRTT